MEWVAVGIIIVSIIAAVAIANKPRKSIQRNIKRMSKTMKPVQNDLNTIKAEKTHLTKVQKSIKSDFQYKASTLKTAVKTMKQSPTWFKELWKSKLDKLFPKV